MKRYESEDKKEMTHSIIGNVFIAENVRQALESADEIKEEVSKAIGGFSHRAQAIIASRLGPTAYIYIPNAKHLEERGAQRRRVHLDIFDESAKCQILIPPSQRVKLPQYKNAWMSDVVLGFYGQDKPNFYELSVFLDGHVGNVKRDLGIRILMVLAKN